MHDPWKQGMDYSLAKSKHIMSTKSTLIGLLILAIIIVAIVLFSKPGNKQVDMMDDYQNTPTTTTETPSTAPTTQYPPVTEPGTAVEGEAEINLPTTGVEEGK